MKDFKVGDEIMGIANDMLGIRLIGGEIKEIIGQGEMAKYITENDEVIYAEQATEYDGFKLMQAQVFFDEAFRLEKEVQELCDSAFSTIYSGKSK